MKLLDRTRDKDSSSVLFIRLLAPLFFLGLGLLLPKIDYFHRMELVAGDAMTKIRHHYQTPANPNLVLVGIDNVTIEQLKVWPFPRRFHGQLLIALSAAQPAVIGWDIFFTTPSNTTDDEQFVEGIRQAGAPVITAAISDASATQRPEFGLTQPLTNVTGDTSQIPSYPILVPFAELGQVSRFGLADCYPDSDGVRRKVPLVVRVGQDYFPNLSLAMLLEYWKVSPAQVKIIPGEAITIESPTIQRRIPIDLAGNYRLNYRHAESDFQAIGYITLFRQLMAKYVENQSIDIIDLKNKILLIGQTSPGLTDMGPTPLESQAALPLVHMNTLNNILNGDFLRLGDPRLVWMGWLVLAYLTIWGNARWRFAVGVGVPGAVILLYLLGAIYLFTASSLLLPVVMPVLMFTGLHVSAIAHQVIIEQRARSRIRAAFASYLSPNVLEAVMKNPSNIFVGVRLPVTILFSDVRDFTSLTESGDEQNFINQLNEYFTVMVDCVNRYDGTLHKFIGDAIMAVWGDTISQGIEKDATNAVNAALAMRVELVELNARWKEQGRPELKIGIGLNHGSVLVGDIGAPQRREFTVMGDPVNLASRLEGVTKAFHNDIIISETVAKLTEGKFILRTLGFVQVKGKTIAVKIFDVRGAATAAKVQNDWLEQYETGFNQYLARDFDVAAQSFSKCLEQSPDDYCSQLYLQACQELLITPPGLDWNGSYAMTAK